MKFPVPFFLILLSLTGCVSVDDKVSTQVGGDKDRAAIRQLMADWERAFNAHDAKEVAATYAQQAESLDQSGMKLVKGREAIQRQVQTRIDENPNVKTKQTELEVRFLSPTLAIQTGYWDDDGLETEFDKKRPKGAWTAVVKKIDGKWLYLIERFWPEQQPE